jgi:endo-1,4-beta-xylanase
MKKVLIKTILISLSILSLSLAGCNKEKKTEDKKEIKKPEILSIPEKTERLCDLTEKYGFKFGVCISYSSSSSQAYLKLISDDFNTITATNEFKAYSLAKQFPSIENKVLTMDYSQADAIAAKAQELGIGVRGHALVWDAYMPDWFFREGFNNGADFVDAKTMKERLRYYITEVVTHFETKFPGVVYCWDVVNEAVADSAQDAFEGNAFNCRKTRDGKSNLFAEILGEDYVKLAFQYAREAVNKVNPDIKLYYNDYNTFQPAKRDNIIKLVEYLNKKDWLCDGVGMQGYIGGYGSQGGCMNPNDINLIKTAINKYGELGVEVQLTEVAVRNYNDDEATMERHAKFYGELFEMLKKINTPESSPFKAITVWGVSDHPGMSKTSYDYKMNGPFCGLYGEFYNIKQSYIEVYNTLKN